MASPQPGPMKPGIFTTWLTNALISKFKRKESTQIPSDLMIKGQEAVSLTSQGKLAEAEVIYRELIAKGSTNYAVFGNLAALCGMQGRFEELIDLLNKAIEQKPDYPEAYNNLGIALQGQGKLTEAITLIKPYNSSRLPRGLQQPRHCPQEQGD